MYNLGNKFMFEFNDTVTVTIEFYIQTHCYDCRAFNPDLLGGNGTTMGFNMRGHATFVGIG
jgi:hypothetical protein